MLNSCKELCLILIPFVVLSGCVFKDIKDDPFNDPAMVASGEAQEKANKEKEAKEKAPATKDAKKSEAKSVTPEPVKAPATLEECINFALRNNEKIKSIREKRGAKNGEIIEAWSDYLPNATFKYNHGRSNETGESDVWNISGKTLIWEGGKVQSKVNSIKAAKAMDNEDLKLEVLETIYQVKKAYYEALFRQYHVDSKRVALESAKVNSEDISTKLQNGQAREVDLLGSKAAVSDAEKELFEAVNEYELVKKHLNHVMGRDLNAEIKLTGKLTFQQIPLHRDKLIEKALAFNPNLKKLEKGIEKSNFSKQAAHRRNFPNLYCVAFYEYRDTEKEYNMGNTKEKLFQGPAYGIGAEVELPLFRPMGIGYGQKKQAEQMMKSLQEESWWGVGRQLPF